MEKNKQAEITQFNEQDCVLGQTNLGIWYGHPYLQTFIFINDPVSYRPGIATLLSYLRWFSFCGQNGYLEDYPDKIDHKYINETADKIITIFTTDRIERANLESLCWGLVALKMLNRLDEVNLSSLVDRIKDKQYPDGGFESYHFDTFVPDLEHTLYAVQALQAVGESPRNLSAVKSFVDSLQVGEYPGGSSYEFMLYDGEKYGIYPSSVSGSWTLIAGTILRNLNFPLNNSEKLLLKREKYYTNYLTNHTNFSLDDQVVELYAIFRWANIFPSRGDEIRESLQPLAYDLLRTLPSDSKWKHIPIGAKLYENFFPLLLARQNRSNPRLNSSISPGGFFKSNSSQQFTLRITNPGPLWYEFSSKSFSVLGEHQNLLSIKDFSLGNYQLSQQEKVDIPFTLEKLPSATNLSASNFTLELTLNVPVVGSNYFMNEYEFFDCKLNFTLALLDDPSEEEKKKKIDPLLLAGLISIPIITVGTAGGGIWLKKLKDKRKKQKEDKKNI